MPPRPAPRPKRGGEEFARTRYVSHDNTSPKKPRFDVRNPSALAADAPEDDAVLEADEIGKRGQQTKRNAVNIDGYESDSSNEGFDARAEAKAAAQNERKSKEQEEDDMFADLEEEDDGENDSKAEVKRAKKGKKAVTFLDVDEIGGQVEASKAGGKVHANFIATAEGDVMQDDEDDSSTSESEVGDEERAEVESDQDDEIGAGGKKKHAPKLDAFNLNAEKEDGGFDEQMNYVRKAVDPDAQHDTWLEGVSKKEMKKAREAQEKRDEERRQQIRADDALLTGDILKTLIAMLERGETVLEALARLGPKKNKKNPKWQNKKKRANEMDVDTAASESAEDPAEAERAQTVEAITGAADKLMSRGNNEIYDTERETLQRLYKRETGEDYVEERREGEPDLQNKQWEYRWSDARDARDRHGPYDSATMTAWNSAGYFGQGVEFRIVGEEGWAQDVEF